ncbi:hypothetical protein L533_0733 [Bordetella bronchiseptica OSU553]|nr:hypothetical protein L533_0733 [Bordetella bronchiseptica OSU553]
MIRRLLLILMLCVPLAACETLQSGQGGADKYSPTALRENLKKGVTTVEDVRRIYGEPRSIDQGPEGVTMMVYDPDTSRNDMLSTAMSAVGLGSVGGAARPESRSLYVHFERNRVVSYSLLSSKN